MNDHYVLYFATGNEYKFQEAEALLTAFELEQVDVELVEIMAEDLEAIAKASVESLPHNFDGPVFVEDSGLFIESLNGFPGPISGYVYETLGNQRILSLLEGVPDRTAYFESVVAIQLPEGRTITFSGRVEGRISEEERGEHGFDYDAIFIPNGARTLAEMASDEKNQYSHRGRALEQMVEFLQDNMT